MNDRTHALSDAGISIWLDDLSRQRLTSGNLAQLVAESNVVGVTTNPTIFAGAISGGSDYDAQVAELAGQGTVVEDVITALTTDDVRDACDLMRPVYDSTGGFDGRVSIEVDPRLAHETEATVAQAKELHALVARENVLVKIPATLAGLPAITAAIAAGISINVTLIFSVDRYRAVLDAYLEGLEQAQAAGLDLSTIHSVASIFISRIDVEVDKRLEEIGTDEALALRGKAALAGARLCHEVYLEVLASDRWSALAEAGANPQRPLWASTATKNPAYSDVLYVEELITEGCVNTMPEKTLQAFADHGEVRGDTVAGTYERSREELAAVWAAGVDLADVDKVLESEGVAKFEEAWEGLLSAMEKQLNS